MPTKTKIYGEHTRNTDGPNLCATCVYMSFAVAVKAKDDIIKCAVFGRLRSKIVECSTYQDKREVRVDAMYQTAWVWMGKINRFVSPAERQGLEDADN